MQLKLNYYSVGVALVIIAIIGVSLYTFKNSESNTVSDSAVDISTNQVEQYKDDVDTEMYKSELRVNGYSIYSADGSGVISVDENVGGVIYSPSGEMMNVPLEIWNQIQSQNSEGGQRITAFEMPIDSNNEEIIYLSTIESLDEQYNKLLNRIYAYDLVGARIEEVFSITTQVESVVDGESVVMYRTVGMDGNKLVLLADHYDNSPGVCTKIWSDYRDKMVYLDLTDISSGLRAYVVPQDLVEKSQIEAQDCLNSL